jgi:hypothetical protein
VNGSSQRHRIASAPLLIVAAALMGLEVIPTVTAQTLVPAMLWVALGTLSASAMMRSLPRGVLSTTLVLFVAQLLVNAGLALSQAPFTSEGWVFQQFLGNAIAGLLVALLIACGDAAVRHLVARAIAPLSFVVTAPSVIPSGPSFNLHTAPAELAGAVIRGSHALRAPPAVQL